MSAPIRPEYLDVLETTPPRKRWGKGVSLVLAIALPLGVGCYWAYEKVVAVADTLGSAKAVFEKSQKFESAVAENPALVHRQRWYVVRGEETVAPEMGLDPKTAPTLWAAAYSFGNAMLGPLPEAIPLPPAKPLDAKLVVRAIGGVDNVRVALERKLTTSPSATLDVRQSSLSETETLKLALESAASATAKQARSVTLRVVGTTFDHLIFADSRAASEATHSAHRDRVERWLNDSGDTLTR